MSRQCKKEAFQLWAISGIWIRHISLNQNSTKFDRKALGCINFYFLPSSKILIEQKAGSFFFEGIFFQKFFKNRKIEKQGFQLKFFENRNSSKILIFEIIQLKSLFFDFRFVKFFGFSFFSRKNTTFCSIKIFELGKK